MNLFNQISETCPVEASREAEAKLNMNLFDQSLEGWPDEASRKAEAKLNNRGIKIPWHFGDKFGDRFKVVGLRAGGIGLVFFVEDTQFKGRIYAAKTLQSFLKSDYLNLPSWKQEIISKAFLEEALPWLEMGQHPNIVSVHLLENIIHPETKRNIPFVFSEYIEKGTLLKIIENKPSLEEIFNVSLQICEGLIHAYKYISVHKDLKPENIMIYDEGIYKITDFSAGVIGTPIYMTPEQLTAFYKEQKIELVSYELPIDHRTDQFAIGLIMVDMLKGGNEERLDYIQSDPLRFVKEGLKDFLVEIPDCLKEILNRCLKPRPEDRFKDISSLKKALLDAYKKEFKREYKFPEVKIDDSPEWWFNRGKAFFNIGRYANAIKPFNNALSIFKAIPRSEIQQANCLMRLGNVYCNIGRFNDSEKFLNHALSIYKAIPGTEIEQAKCLMNLGNIYCNIGRFNDAERFLNNALNIFKAIPRSEINQAKCLVSLGNVYCNIGRFNDAEKHYKDALNIYKAIPGTEIEQAECLVSLGNVYCRTGYFSDAERFLNNALNIYKAIPGTEIEQANCFMNLGSVYGITGKFNDAERFLNNALNIYKAIPGTEIQQAKCLMNLGNVYRNTGKFNDAERFLNNALNIYKAIPGTEIQQAKCLMNLGNVYCNIGRFNDAERYYREALNIYKTIPGTEIEQARCLMNFGILYISIQQFKKARNMAEEALKICERYPIGTERIKEVCLRIIQLITFYR